MERTISDSKPLKKIMIDVTFLFDQYSFRGIGRYGKELLKRMLPMILNTGEWEIFLVGFYDIEKALMQMKFSKLMAEELADKITYVSLGEPYPSSFQNIFKWNKTYGTIINQYHPDIFFAIHFERGLPSHPVYSKNLIKVPKTVVMIHDMIPVIFNSFSSKNRIYNFLKGQFYKYMFRAVPHADLILTPSHFSQSDIIKYAEIPEEKVEVIYHGIDGSFFRSNYNVEEAVESVILEKYKLKDCQYFFFDSGLEENKGIDELLEIAQKFFSKTKTKITKLAITSGKNLNVAEGKELKSRTALGKQFLKKAKLANVLTNVVSLGLLTDEELVIILKNSTAHLYFSKYEGFGFGPLQAMAEEIPSIAANQSCIPEITRDGSLLIDLKDPKDSAKQIEDLLSNPKKISEMIKRGQNVVKSYTWDLAAEKTWNKLSSII